MAQEIYELHSTRTKEVARLWVREILVFFVLTASLIFFTDYYSHPVEYRYFEDTFILAIALGVPGGVVVWSIYRVLRFAFGR